MIRFGSQTQRRVLVLVLMVTLAFVVRALTANFIRAHLSNPAWFQSGAYAIYDREAQAVLDRSGPLFWINDPSRTDRIVYPPGFPFWVALLYRTTGLRSPVSIQWVQIVLDSLSVMLIVGIGATAYRWRVGIVGGVLASISPLLALAGATPNADAPTAWLILAGVWCLLLAAKKKLVRYAVAAGFFLGVACWFRVNPLLLFLIWAGGLFFFLRAGRRTRLLFAGALTLTTLLIISPIVIRNLVVFYPQVAPTGLGIGWNLLAGIGETERGAEFGVPCCDAEMVQQDRRALNLPADAELTLFYPNGIQRDRERGRRALRIVASHPVWFAGVMARRIGGHLKFAGRPAPNVGSAGFNVTRKKCLPPERQSGPIALAVDVLGMAQSVMRYLILPLMLLGVFMAWRSDWRFTALILATVVYYLVTLAVGHSEIRYGLPMQALLFVFAGTAVTWLSGAVTRVWRTRTSE